MVPSSYSKGYIDPSHRRAKSDQQGADHIVTNYYSIISIVALEALPKH